MINLMVEEYCHECEKFEPHAAVLIGNGVHTLVTCTHKAECRRIYEYLKDRQKAKKTMEDVADGNGEA